MASGPNPKRPFDPQGSELLANEILANLGRQQPSSPRTSQSVETVTKPADYLYIRKVTDLASVKSKSQRDWECFKDSLCH